MLPERKKASQVRAKKPLWFRHHRHLSGVTTRRRCRSPGPGRCSPGPPVPLQGAKSREDDAVTGAGRSFTQGGRHAAEAARWIPPSDGATDQVGRGLRNNPTSFPFRRSRSTPSSAYWGCYSLESSSARPGSWSVARGFLRSWTSWPTFDWRWYSNPLARKSADRVQAGSLRSPTRKLPSSSKLLSQINSRLCIQMVLDNRP